jgi:hypothetical protein
MTDPTLPRDGTDLMTRKFETQPVHEIKGDAVQQSIALLIAELRN